MKNKREEKSPKTKTGKSKTKKTAVPAAKIASDQLVGRKIVRVKAPSKRVPTLADLPETMSTRSLKCKLEKELQAEKVSIEHRLKSIQIEPSENGGDFGDMSSALSDEGMKMIERDRLLKKLSSVNLVISRIHNNPNFADCDDCGEEIDLKRLLLMPTARRCIFCQQISEK